MKLQINRLGIRIEEMWWWGGVNKELEEIKKNQAIMNDAKLRSKTLWREPTVE